MLAQGAQLALNMGSTAVLARLLTPADFGLTAMVAAFTGFVGLFKDMGLSMATVQRRDITHAQVSTLFWINVAVSLVLTGISAAMAPAVAWFYGEPRLVLVTLALSAIFIFGGLTAQHAALLQRQMRFGQLAAIDVLATTVGVAGAIALALIGARYWALVAMVAIRPIVGMLGTWWASGWWPGLPHRGSGVIPLLKFGGNLTGFNTLNYLTRNADNVLIGARLGAGPLGLYSKAYNLLMMPIRQISAPMGAVALPALCHLQRDPTRYRSYYLRAIEIIAFCGMPLVAFTFIAADDLVRLLLGPQWTEAATAFRCLAPAAFVGTLNVAPGWLCGSLGTTERQFRWAMFSAPVAVAGFVLGLRWGIVGVSISFSVTWCVLFLVLLAYACKGSPVRMRDIALKTWRVVAASIAAAAVSAFVALPACVLYSPIARALSVAGVFAIAFSIVYAALPGGSRSLHAMLSAARGLRYRSR